MSYMGYALPMRTKRFRVTLTPTEQEELCRIISFGKAPARKLMHGGAAPSTKTSPPR